MARPWWAEPTVHFVALGAALFGLHALVAPPPPPSDRTVRVTAADADALAEAFARRSGRAPTEAERRGLVDDHIDEEVLVREALALGLERSDPIVRRRLAQKMEFLLEDSAPLAPAGDAELAAYLAAHAADFAEPERIDFEQRFFRDEAAARAALPEPGPAAGQAFPLGRAQSAPRARVAALFGAGFADALAAAPIGGWAGPIRSSYGWHLVRVGGRSPGGPPPLAAVRERVAAAWADAQRADARRAAVQALRARYSVE